MKRSMKCIRHSLHVWLPSHLQHASPWYDYNDTSVLSILVAVLNSWSLSSRDLFQVSCIQWVLWWKRLVATVAPRKLTPGRLQPFHLCSWSFKFSMDEAADNLDDPTLDLSFSCWTQMNRKILCIERGLITRLNSLKLDESRGVSQNEIILN